MTIIASGVVQFRVTEEMNQMVSLWRRVRRGALTLAALLLWLASGSLLSVAVAAPPGIPPLEIKDFVARAVDAGDQDYTVSGGHPETAVTSFRFPELGGSAAPEANVEMVKSTYIELPAGFVGNPAVTRVRCTYAQLAVGFGAPPNCPAASAVGTIELSFNHPVIAPDGTNKFVIYNMVPERGYPAQFGFNFQTKNIFLYPRLRPRSGQYGVTIASPGIAPLGITRVKAELYGVPSQHSFGSLPPVGEARVPFLSNPVDCLVAAPVTNMFADTWELPGRLLAAGSADFGLPDVSDPTWHTASAVAPAVTGCDGAGLVSQFVPGLDMRPSAGTGSSRADAPSGFTVDLDFPQAANDPTDSSSRFDPAVPSAPALKDATVMLPVWGSDLAVGGGRA